MRRIFAVLFVAFFGFGPFVATLEASDDARLPACCRAHGAHHCAMSAAMRARMFRTESRTPGFTAPSTCPLYPGFLSQAIAPEHALPATTAAFVAHVAYTVIRTTLHSATCNAPRDARTVRGPPAIPLT